MTSDLDPCQDQDLRMGEGSGPQIRVSIRVRMRIKTSDPYQDQENMQDQAKDLK